MNDTEDLLLTLNSTTKTLAEWSEIYGIDVNILYERLCRCKMDLSTAIMNSSSRKRERVISYGGRRQNLRQWSSELGIPYYCLRSRLNNLHWTVKKAFETPYEREGEDDK